MTVDLALWIILLDTSGDGGHRFHRFHREIPDGGFVGEHHSIGAIQNRVGHITDFRTCRPRAGCHRIQHLRCGDDRDAKAVGFLNQLLLQQRNFFSGHFYAEVSTGDHDAVAQGKDGIDLVDRLEFFNLGHHRCGVTVAADQIADFLHIGGVTDETQGDPINPLA